MQRLLITIPLLVVMLPGCGNTPTDLGGPGDGTLGSTVVDSDGDGFSDDVENNSNPGTDPFDATDNPNNVRDTDGDGCSDYDELTLDGSCDNDPNTPVSEAFDGFWEVEGTLEPGQNYVGATRVHVEVRGGRAACVSRAKSDYCPNLDYREPSASRPITLNNGVILLEFTMDFPQCLTDRFEEFDGEKWIEVTVGGVEIPGTDGLVFDVVIEERYLLSNITLLSTGTLEHWTNDTTNSCD